MCFHYPGNSIDIEHFSISSILSYQFTIKVRYAGIFTFYILCRTIATLALGFINPRAFLARACF
jgi:hypothetical protein